MAQQTPPSSLQVEENMAFQHRTWTAERIGWSVMALVILAALLGLFAVGPLSWTTKSDASGLLRIDYGHIQRQTAPMTIKVDVAPAAISGNGIELETDQAFLSAFKISTIRPTPAETIATPSGLRFRFRAEPGARPTIYFELSPEEIGWASPRLGLTGHKPVELPVFIYP